MKSLTSVPIFERRNLHIALLGDAILHATWQGVVDTATNQLAYHFLADYARKNNKFCWLLNQKKMMLYPEACTWVTQTFLPQQKELLEKGICAVVMADSFFVEYNIRQSIQSLFPQGSLQCALFKEENVAFKWLKEQIEHKDFKNFDLDLDLDNF
jgi:hypothetical protein